MALSRRLVVTGLGAGLGGFGFSRRSARAAGKPVRIGILTDLSGPYRSYWSPPVSALRFIPAGAGNAGGLHALEIAKPVHPRRRGERSCAATPSELPSGSSPQARGTPPTDRATVAQRRFIPAGAGNARPPRTSRPGKTVHPRRRGERRFRQPHVAAGAGSSPQARGTPRHRAQPEQRHRFIPAGAGNAMKETSQGAPITVHPRRRGERSESGSNSRPSAGSSPQARGTRSCARFRSPWTRFIPAGAGNAPRNS